MSAGVAAARSSPLSVRHSEQIRQDRAQPLADRPTALEAQAGWRRSKETSAKARPGRREPLSAITAGSVSLVAMLIPGPVITSG